VATCCLSLEAASDTVRIFVIALAQLDVKEISHIVTRRPEFYQQTITVGASSCQKLRYFSDSSLRCVVVPGPGDFLDVTVSVSGQRGVLANS
jgi:hypothetical protein